MYEVYDTVCSEAVYWGSERECNAYISRQAYWNDLVVRQKTNEETVPSEWWSGGFSKNH